MLLPMIMVFDRETDSIVKCAVIKDCGGWWICKPLNEDNFDPKAWLSTNLAFSMAWWRIGKDDLSAEPLVEQFDTSILHRLQQQKLEEFLQRAGQSS